MSILEKIDIIDSSEYKKSYPFPYTFIDNIIEEEFAKNTARDIGWMKSVGIDMKSLKKYTLRDKNNFRKILSYYLNIYQVNYLLKNCQI